MRNVYRLLGVLAISHVAMGQASMSVQMNKPEKPVIGLPFSADQTVTIVQHLANGTMLKSEVTGHVYRSAAGVERFDGTISAAGGADPVTMAYILDRQKHSVVLLNMKAKTATIEHLPENSSVSVKFLPLQQSRTANQVKPSDYVTSDLGRRTEGTTTLVGRRVSGTIPAGKLGNDQPLTVSADVWVDLQLKVAVNEVEQNPLAGERTFQLSNMRSEEPDPALFEIPEGFTVKDKPPMPTSLPKAVALGTKLGEENIPEALGSTDPVFKNSVAYALANDDSHLSDAQTLAEEAVKAVEQKTAETALKNDREEDYQQSVILTSYWDTLGWVYFREGRLDKAEAYLSAAWKLKPNSEYALHLGSVYEAQKRPKDAATIYRMVLNPKSNSSQQAELNKRLAGTSEVLASDASTDLTSPLPSFSPLPGAADPEPTVDILIGHGGAPAVSYISSEPAHAEALTHAIQAAVAGFLPDAGPETILRRARVSCAPGKGAGCELHFIVPPR